MSTAITIRSIQHYLYCAHRWGLMTINQSWAENAFVTKANLLHERVHDFKNSYVLRGKKTFTSVSVYTDAEPYNMYGVVDCLEVKEAIRGITIPGYDKEYSLTIVEYKPKKPKIENFNEEDLMQIFAQKICVDAVFGGDCEAIIYYADVKRRVSLPLKEHFEEYDNKLRAVLQEMRINMAEGIIPPIKKKQYCNGCSLRDICMSSMKPIYSIRSTILKTLE
jgi:CRISPR-associated exonuclease Cas4